MTTAGLDLLGGDPDEALRRVLARAGGQPFLPAELLRGLCEEGLVTVVNATTRLAAGAGLPRRFVDSVADQLARLTAPAHTNHHHVAEGHMSLLCHPR